GEEVIRDGQDGVAERDGRFLLAAPRDEPVVLRSEIGVTGSTARVRGFDEGGPEPGITLARLAALTFPGTLIIARTHASPRGEMGRGWESGHIRANLRDHDLGDASTDAWDGVEAVEGVVKRAHPLLHFGVQLLDEFVQAVEMSELAGKQEALMRSDLADQCTLQLGKLGAQLPLSEVGQDARVDGASDQRAEDVAS